jgi:hypothetical protein
MKSQAESPCIQVTTGLVTGELFLEKKVAVIELLLVDMMKVNNLLAGDSVPGIQGLDVMKSPAGSLFMKVIAGLVTGILKD